MVTRMLDFFMDEHYHVYNRGNDKRDIFLNKSDYFRFIQLLYIANTSEQYNFRDLLKTHDSVFDVERTDLLVHIHGFCLMKNHYHLLLTPVSENSLSHFMLKLGTGYSMYFNTKYERSGGLFESRFKAKHADTDEYFKYLFSYIHLNPVRSKNELGRPQSLSTFKTAFKQAVDYPYSSLSAYLPNASSPRAALGLEEVLHKEMFEMYFPTQETAAKELHEWLQYDSIELFDSALGLP